MIKIKANGRKIAKIRITQGLLGSSFAKLVGVSKQTIYTIEKNTVNPGPVVARKIADVLHTDYEELFEVIEVGE